MADAYVLAGELARHEGRHVEAFARYYALLAPAIAQKQAKARRFAASFVPRSRFRIGLRDIAIHLMALPGVARLFVKSMLSEQLVLDEY